MYPVEVKDKKELAVCRARSREKPSAGGHSEVEMFAFL